MAKGTKQIRMGKVVEFRKQVQTRKRVIENVISQNRASGESTLYLEGHLSEINEILNLMNESFEFDDVE